MNRRQSLISFLLAGGLAAAGVQAQSTTPDTGKTRLGDLKFEQGYPTEETAQKLFDEIDYQRAVQAYLWAYPAVGLAGSRAEGNGFPAIFNIEADPREEVNIVGTSVWAVAPYLKLIGEYYKSLENHPNPTPVKLTEFGK